jgi:hypothetical protein
MAENPFIVPFSTGFLDTGYGGGRISKQNPSFVKALLDTDYEAFEPKSSDSGNLYETPDSPDYKSDPYGDYIERLPDIYAKIAPIQAGLQRQASELALQQSLRQTAGLYPFLSAAGAESTERALDASKRFLARKMQEQRGLEAFRESLPTTQQAIMSAKQQQQSAASSDFLQEAAAIAKASDAAKDFAETGLGKYRYIGS